MKINKTNFLFLRAKKILKNHYAEILHGRDLTEEEVKIEAKNILRKWDDVPYLVNMQFACALKREEWEKIVNA